MCQGVKDTIPGRYVVVAAPMEVLSVWLGFLYTEDIWVLFWSWRDSGVQERDGAIVLVIFHGELEMWVNGINVMEELLAMFYLLDDTGVIFIPESKRGWIGGSADGMGFKFLNEQIGY